MQEEIMAGFKDIIGHEMIKDHFQKAIEYHKVSHAYILSGEQGMGRKTLAKAFAMTLLCEKSDKEPCMECHSCKQILSGNHPDSREAEQHRCRRYQRTDQRYDSD
jgi:DNA polymerase-3 subunit delta'